MDYQGEKLKANIEALAAEHWDNLVEHIADGGSISSYCAANGLNRVQIWRMYNQPEDEAHKARRLEIALAEQFRADMLVAEILNVADDTSGDLEFRTNERGEMVPGWNKEHINRTRLRVDTRKWIAAKHYARRYGDLVKQEISGPDGGPMQIKAAIDRPPPTSYEEWKRIVAEEQKRPDLAEDDDDIEV